MYKPACNFNFMRYIIHVLGLLGLYLLYTQYRYERCEADDVFEAWWTVLHGARSIISAQLDVQVQSVRRRDRKTALVTRVSQRFTARRRTAQVNRYSS